MPSKGLSFLSSIWVDVRICATILSAIFGLEFSILVDMLEGSTLVLIVWVVDSNSVID